METIADINTICEDVIACIIGMLSYETFVRKARCVCRRWNDIIENYPILKSRAELFIFLRRLSRHYSAQQIPRMEKIGLLQHTRFFIDASTRYTAWVTWSSLTIEDKDAWKRKFLCTYTTNRRTKQILTVFSVMQMLVSQQI